MLQTTNVVFDMAAVKAEVVRKSPAARRASSILASGTIKSFVTVAEIE
ncbi:hypothetical protein [Allopusillimonas soli]|uniref:Uncharacterized protein n=1 Tax=Allopusillimonas soli TaxID=659016 RepID=A0A853F7L3_9BURK|nr:hypothetical protein [Allopusillimonas soli]NYT35808.1 hypothetical protein [Allopusillimonas soli]